MSGPKGGKGALELGTACYRSLLKLAPERFNPLYNWDMPVEDKIETIAQRIYGAEHVDYNSKRQTTTKTN